MKKFGKILIYVILLYIFLYASYNIFLLLQVLDIYFVIFFVLFCAMSFWLFVGLFKPKKLPFLKITQNRIMMVLIYAGFSYALFLGVIVIETSFYKRDAMRSLKRNIVYLVNFFHNVHPFDGDSYSITNTQSFIQEPQIDEKQTEIQEENLPKIHKVTISEVKQEFPEEETKN